MQTTHTSDTLTVKITPNDHGNPAGKLADAELHFGGDSPLTGLKLIGFSIWERRGGTGRTVTVSHAEKSGADVARGHGPSTERVQVSWHDRHRRCLCAGRWPKTGDVCEANGPRPSMVGTSPRPRPTH